MTYAKSTQLNIQALLDNDKERTTIESDGVLGTSLQGGTRSVARLLHAHVPYSPCAVFLSARPRGSFANLTALPLPTDLPGLGQACSTSIALVPACQIAAHVVSVVRACGIQP